MDYYVYSKLVGDQCYTLYKPLEKGSRAPLSQRRYKVFIKGGANVAKGRTPEIITPMGVRTKITEEEFDALKKCKVFRIHLENKHIIVDQVKANPDKVAKNELEPDVSRPRVPEDFKEGARPEGSKKK